MRIAFTGAQGTGKSTLAEAIAARSGLPILNTPGRLMADRDLPVNQDATVISQTLAWLLQLELEESQVQWIATRCVIDIWAYAALAAERQRPTRLEAELLRQLETTTRLLMSHRYNLLFYLPPRIPLHVDEVRSGDLEFQRRTDVAICGALVQWSVPHLEIDVTDSDAVTSVLAAVEEVGA